MPDFPPDDWPTSSEAAKRLNISVRTLHRRERDGLLHPRVDAQGYRRYDPAELEAATAASPTTTGANSLSTPPAADAPAPAQTSGKLAALVFERLSRRVSPRQLVAELQQPPEVIQRLHRQWITMGVEMMLTHEHQLALRRMGLRPFSTPEQLLETVAEVVALAHRFMRITFPCAACNRPVQMDHRAWKAVLESRVLFDWGHGDCIDKGKAK